MFSDDFDTSEKCRAPAWTDRVLWRRRRPIAEIEKQLEWNSGQLVHYNRSELKQSDHRPVIAIIDVEIYKIDEQLRNRVFYEVIKDLGPPDGTIVIEAEYDDRNGSDDDTMSIYDENLMSALIQELAQIGEVTLVRFVGEKMWVIFRDGQAALTAVSKKHVQICGVNLNIELKTCDWIKLVEKEIALCTTNTVPLSDYSQFANQGDYNGKFDLISKKKLFISKLTVFFFKYL